MNQNNNNAVITCQNEQLQYNQHINIKPLINN